MPTSLHSLAEVPLFEGLPDAVLARLQADSRLRHVARGQILCSEGDPGNDLLILVRGRVRVSRFAAEGREVVLADVEAPSTFGELALIDGVPRSATLTALTDIDVRSLGRRQVMDLAEREPGVAMAMLRGIVAMVRNTNDRLVEVLALSVSARLARWLLEQAGDTDSVELRESQESLGTHLGTTRVSVNRILHKFARMGAIRIDGSKIEILDRPLLESFSDS